MPATIQGLTGPVWGTIGDEKIIIDNISESHNGERETLADGDGDIVAASYYGNVIEVSMDFQIKDKDTVKTNYLLSRGAELTLPTGETDIADSKTLYIDTWEKSKSKGGWMSGSLTAHHYPSMS